MSDFPNLVTTDWLAQNLERPGLVVLHVSYYLGAPGWSPEGAFARGHIPGARLFDIDKVCDQENPLPHMLSTAEEFSKAAATLGISNDDHVVVYDDGGVRPSFRVWWTFKTFGHEKVSVLDGGLMKWAAEGLPITDERAKFEPGTYKAVKNEAMVCDKKAVLETLETTHCEILDARGPGRFTGAEQDPRPGVKSGHMPGAKNLFFRTLFRDDHTLRDPAELKALVEQSGLGKSKPVITTCGSGVTASILYFVLSGLGFKDLHLYDGSWAEWATAPDTPVEQG